MIFGRIFENSPTSKQIGYYEYTVGIKVTAQCKAHKKTWRLPNTDRYTLHKSKYVTKPKCLLSQNRMWNYGKSAYLPGRDVMLKFFFLVLEMSVRPRLSCCAVPCCRACRTGIAISDVHGSVICRPDPDLPTRCIIKKRKSRSKNSSKKWQSPWHIMFTKKYGSVNCRSDPTRTDLYADPTRAHHWSQPDRSGFENQTETRLKTDQTGPDRTRDAQRDENVRPVPSRPVGVPLKCMFSKLSCRFSKFVNVFVEIFQKIEFFAKIATGRGKN